MEKKHEFYPMITATVKELITLSELDEYMEFLIILQNYPNLDYLKDKTPTPVLFMLIKELDRQYARWNKGGNK